MVKILAPYALVVAFLVAHFAVGEGSLRTVFDSSCNIKGNISRNNGKLIFHVPGQKDYERTIIRTDYGERWFCSEEEARAHGWVKATR